MNKLQVIKNIRCYLDEKDDAYFNLEDTAKGLGFTDTTKIDKNGNRVVYVKWDRIKQYLTSFKFSTEVSKDTFIPEPILYLLSMKAENETAKAFQHTIAYDILPTLRKTGTYSVNPYKTKSTSLGEVASFIKVMRSLMKENNQPPEKIAEMAEAVCKQFNVNIPENFVKRNPFQMVISANFFLAEN